MKRLLFLVLLTGCPVAGGGNGGECATDNDCNGEVCANTHECLPSDQVYRVAVHWTLQGQTPTAALCAPSPVVDVTIETRATGDSATYAPVECATGLFSFAKLPTRYDYVNVMAESYPAFAEAAIPAGGGDVYLDLPFGFADAAPAP